MCVGFALLHNPSGGRSAPMIPAAIDRFWACVDEAPGFGRAGTCWRWTGRRNVRTRRAIFRVGGKQVYAARWLFEQVVRPLADGERCLHLCDNVECVNPAHLFAGTQLDNIRDRDAKGRNRLAATHCKSGHLLTGDNVRLFGPNGRWRHCRQCGRNATRAYRTRRLEAEAHE